MKKFTLQISFALALFISSNTLLAQIVQDTTATDSNTTLPYDFNADQTGSLYLYDFENYNVVYDAQQDRYLVVTTIGDYEISYPIVMTQKEYSNYRLKKDMHDYYKGKISAISGKKKNSADEQKDLLPKYYVNSSFFETLFGSNEIEVNMQGNIEIKMGVLYQRVDNPQLNESNRQSTIFDFNQNIGASIMAKVGKRLKVSANYDTQSTFDFQNLVKLEFDPSTGFDDDGIVRKIEVGNVSMPLQNSLITGAQNLFGLKTELQFGKTTISAVYAKQQSQSKTVRAEGSSIIEEFGLQASDYDPNRHFFLAQYFKDNFDNSLINYPLVNSSIQITSIELWVTNTNRTTENVRNIVALSDLGESVPVNIGNVDVNINAPLANFIPDNEVNELYSTMNTSTGPIRNISTVSNAFLGVATMAQGRDYSVLENARRLVRGIDFELDPQLGYLSLNRRLADSDVLAVAFEYSVNGSSKIYKVGELSSDGVIAPDNLVVKLLRSELVITDIPLWDLMMKNIYNLQAHQLKEEGFRFEVLYENDATGVPLNILQTAITGLSTPDEDDDVNLIPLLNLLYIDRLDQNDGVIYDEHGDGYFDFVEGITIKSNKGYMMFPKVQPFGSYLETILTDIADEGFIFNELYEYTQQEVKNNYQQKDKYEIRGYYKSDSAQGISLGAFNVPQGSVHVTSGGRELVEGVDYVVDYQIGRVKIINPSIEASNAPIQVSVEQNAIFSQQRRSFFGIDIEHKFSDNFVAGASYLNLSEQPFTNKVLFGQEPIQNSVLGLNASYNTEAPILTKWVNKLPFMETDMVSNFSIRGDVAYLIPGSPKSIEINGEAASYIDDFEGSQIPLDVRSQQQWYLASTPQSQPILNLGGDATNSLDYGKQRARLAWYNIDNDLHGGAQQPDNIDNNEISRAEVRRVSNSELFPNDEQDLTESTILRTLDLAFYPSERGTYNFDVDNLNTDGTFNNPEDRWGGITRPLTVTDFENSNIEYIQFWMMNPYGNYSITNDEGLPAGVDPQNPINQVGELYFNLGNVSEDVLKDNRKVFENGLPETGGLDNTAPTIWGKVPTNQSLLYAFDDSDAHRLQQDIGLDGLSDLEESALFATYISSLPAGVQAAASLDPASDNFQFYKGGALDDQNATILQRYKNFNRTQGNSPTANMSPESYPTAATQYPDTEDINKDQTMSTVEGYYQYKVSLNAADLQVGLNYIVDERITTNTLVNGSTQSTTWYQFRIPIGSGEPINGINSFHSIRFMRMFMTKFKMPVVLRFGQMEMVRGEWRRYKYTLDDGTQLLEDVSTVDNFDAGVVNIEENDTRNPVPYVLPPGIERERLQGTTTVQLQNEQSLSLKIRDLKPEEGRTLFKNVRFDMRMFKRLQMFIHAESVVSQADVEDDELVAIIRIGSDLSDNYYQIEHPLKMTAFFTSTAADVWPEVNELNVDLEVLKKLKLERYEIFGNAYSNILYPEPVAGEPVAYRLRVKGHPNLGNIKTIMLGVKNKASVERSAEIWFNELRVSEFDNEGGWAAVVSADANFADLMDVAVTGRMSTKGYGNVDQSVSERSQEDVKQYDLVSNLNAGKLFPENWGLQLPLNFSVGEEIKDPKYDAQYQDILLSDTNDTNSPNRNDAQDYTKRTSVSLINFKKNRNPQSTKKQRFYDVENLAFSYAFNEVEHRDYNIKKFLDQNVRASAGYTYSFKPFEITPFKKTKALNSQYFKLIKDFNINLLPSDISFNTNILRSYNEQLSRSLVDIPGFSELPTLKQHNYLFDWDYNIGYKPTKSIKLNFRALNNNVYDEFDNSDDITLYQNFFTLGRPTHYHQSLDGSYQIPLGKIPIFSFIKSNYSYSADFDWQGASSSYVEQIGNTVQNANTHNLSVDLNMKKFYKEIGMTKLLRSKSQRNRAKKAREKARNSKKKEGSKVADKPKSKNERVTKAKSSGQKIFRGFYDVVTALKTVKLSYSENNGTFLPGYQPEIGLLGRDNFSGSLAPTFGFVFGSQVDIRNRALENGWLISRNLDDPNDLYYNKIFSRTHYEKLDFTAKVTPFKNFDINIQANKIYTRNITEQMDVVFDTNTTPYFNDAVATEAGSFSMSFFMLGTSFDDNDVLFQQFKENRNTIAQRLSNESGLAVSGYGSTSQEVVLPAFLAAYSGQSVDKVSLNPFRNIPLPNWNVKYRGFMKMKWFKKHFSSFSVSHAYRSSYSIVNFSNNLQYDTSAPEVLDISGNYFNERLYTNVGLIEEFSRLGKVEMKLKNSLSLSGRINTDRLMTLNLNNNTMTQDNGKEYVVGLGYRIKDLPFTMRLQGKKQKFKGDLNLKLDVSLRDNKMIIRYFGEDDTIENDQVTGGQNMFNLRFMADYSLTKNLQTGFYYLQDASKYAISTTYPRKSISAGISFKYNLGN